MVLVPVAACFDEWRLVWVCEYSSFVYAVVVVVFPVGRGGFGAW